jgi:hypothetical protein
MKNELNESRVVFQVENHTYDLDGKALHGVTDIVKWVFDETYDGIPVDVLKRAAERGTAVHTACELWDEFGIVTEDEKREVSAYRELCEANGLKALESEYLVSNETTTASSIDKVFEPTGDEYPLADIKGTSQYHEENVALQLSIYAYLFERQNKGKRAGRLMCIWLPREQYGQPRLFDVPRIPADQVEFVMEQFDEGGDPVACQQIVRSYLTPATTEDWLPANIKQVELEVVQIEQEAKRLEARSKELRAGLLELMQQNNVKKWEGEHIVLTRKEASVRTTLDTTKVKSQYPDVYAECTKESKTSESLMIKIK